MINKFLKAKHWQLFTLMFGIPFVAQIIMMVTILIKSVGNLDDNPLVFISYLKFIPWFMFLYLALFFGWFWSMAIGLQDKLPENITMKVERFKIFFFIPLFYMLFILFYMGVTLAGMPFDTNQPSPVFLGTVLILVFPLHLFSMFCMFYMLYFVSKTIKTVELQKEVNFADFAGEFFLLWFFPVGIWIVQPKINKMVEE